MARGRIFSIQRFSVHDGSGIRTTVFFKGCTLRCAWCQNPEGTTSEKCLLWSRTNCIQCGTCVTASMAGGARFADGQIRIDRNAPENWNVLTDACPCRALRWDCEDVTTDEIMQRIERDRPFYAHGDGGVTLSGGEPLLQKDFGLTLLTACRSSGIHTTVETALNVPESTAGAFIRAADRIYADCKCVDTQLCQTYLGSAPDLILRNLAQLLSGRDSEKATVRTPLIPGVTATESNVRSIARFLAAYNKDVPYELLNYNPFAEGKYELLGQPYMFRGTEPLTDAEVERLRAAARSEGLANVL